MSDTLTPREIKTLEEKGHGAGYDTVRAVGVMAPFIAEGYIRFYRLPHGWTCGYCSDRVTIARFRHHVEKVHGIEGRRR